MNNLDHFILDLLAAGPLTAREVQALVNRDTVRPRSLDAIRSSLNRLHAAGMVSCRAKAGKDPRGAPCPAWRLRS